MPKVKSELWNFFIKTSSGGRCKFCSSDIKTSGNTTNLKKHLLRKHPNVSLKKISVANQEITMQDQSSTNVEEMDDTKMLVGTDTNDSNCSEDDIRSIASGISTTQESSESLQSFSTQSSVFARQPTITESLAKVQSFKGGSKATALNNSVIYMIVKDNLSLNTTEHEGFKYLMSVATPLYKPPVHKTVSTMISEKYDALSRHFKQQLSNVNSITLTMDVWTETMRTVSFLGVTAHFYLNNKLNTVTISVLELEERHTADYLQTCMKKICDEWDISQVKISAVVTDNGANIVKAVHDFFGKNKHLPCFAHTLDLVASNIIYEVGDVKNIIDKVKTIVKYFKQSVNLSDELRHIQSLSNSDNVYKLIQMVPTRWNSAFYMLQRFLDLSSVIAPILIKYPKAPTMVDANDLQTIKEVIQVLSPIEEVSKEISGDKYLTVSKIIPIMNCLKHKLQQLSFSSEGAQLLKNMALQGVSKRFGVVEQVNILACATILDPRFKKVHFNNKIHCSYAINSIDKECKLKGSQQSSSNIAESSNTRVSKSDSLWSLHETLKENTQYDERTDELFIDLRHYLNRPLTDLKSDPLLFWNDNEYHVLKEIALKYLSIVGTSVPCERVFSQAGNIMTAKRNNLGGEMLSKLLFLKSLNLEDWQL